MEEARALISVFHELNATNDRKIALFSSSLIGLFGSTRMFEDFLSDLDKSLTNGTISAPVKERATNLARTYIPQVAQLNGIDDINGLNVSAEQLRAIKTSPPHERKEGVRTILAALIRILEAVKMVG